jgi:hypothetical protein
VSLCRQYADDISPPDVALVPGSMAVARTQLQTQSVSASEK